VNYPFKSDEVVASNITSNSLYIACYDVFFTSASDWSHLTPVVLNASL